MDTGQQEDFETQLMNDAFVLERCKVMATYKFPNGSVATFDWDGKQVPFLQGAYCKELELKIRQFSDENTVWNGVWETPLPLAEMNPDKEFKGGDKVCHPILGDGIYEEHLFDTWSVVCFKGEKKICKTYLLEVGWRWSDVVYPVLESENKRISVEEFASIVKAKMGMYQGATKYINHKTKETFFEVEEPRYWCIRYFIRLDPEDTTDDFVIEDEFGEVAHVKVPFDVQKLSNLLDILLTTSV